MSLSLASFRQWLFHRQDDAVVPIVLNRRRIYIVPTWTGVLYVVVLVMMLIASINYILSLGYVLVFLLVGVGIVGMIHTWRNLAGLSLSPGFATPVFAGEAAQFPLQIENSWPLTRYALQICFGKGRQTVRCNARGKDLVSVHIPWQTDRRGRFNPGRIKIFTTYPLGLFHAWSYLYPPITALVYPRPVNLPLPTVFATSHPGEQQGRAGNEDFSGLRQWQNNDSPRHIAWKAVARDMAHRPLLVKEFVGGATQELWLDWSLTPDRGSVEDKLSILTGWVLAAENLQVRYGLRLPGCVIEPAQGEAHRTTCLEALALYDLAEN